MPLHTVKTAYADDASTVPLAGTVYNVALEANAIIPVPAGSVNLAKVISFKYTKVVCYCLAVGTQTAAQVTSSTASEAAAGTILVNVNSTGSPAPAITVVAKTPHAFAPCIFGSVNEFSADVTTFYLNNAGAADLVLIVKVGLNV